MRDIVIAKEWFYHIQHGSKLRKDDSFDRFAIDVGFENFNHPADLRG